MDSANHRRKTSLFFCSAKPSKRCHDIATCIGLVRLAPPAEEQSGDRQRREKSPPILTAGKDEHERAPRKCEITQLYCARHYEPRRQNGQSKPFSRSRRAAGFLLHTSLSPPKEKCERPMGRQFPPPAPESARQPPLGTASSKVDVHRYKHEAFLRTAIARFTLPCLFAQTPSLPYHPPLPHQRACQSPMMQKRSHEALCVTHGVPP